MKIESFINIKWGRLIDQCHKTITKNVLSMLLNKTFFSCMLLIENFMKSGVDL